MVAMQFELRHSSGTSHRIGVAGSGDQLLAQGAQVAPGAQSGGSGRLLPSTATGGGGVNGTVGVMIGM